MKRAARRVLKSVAHRLPTRLQGVLVEQFCEDVSPWRVLGQVAPRCHLTSVKVSGAYGTIQSAPTDHHILRVYAETGYWARRTNDTLLEFFRGRRGRYIDVGANIGLTTIPLAQNPDVRCLAIEPEPTNFANLTANVAANCPHRNVELLQAAAFSRHDTLALEVAPSNNLGDHRLRLQDRPGRFGEHAWSTVLVKALPLDDIVGSTEAPVAVKIDAQGAEPFIVAGGGRVLAGVELLITEWSPYWIARLGADPSTMTDFLREHFRDISIAAGEDGVVGTAGSPAAAGAQLLELAHRHRDDPSEHFDIVGRK